MNDLIERAEKLLIQCAIHDYGLAGACTCSPDHRPIVIELIHEIQRLTDSEDSRVVLLEAERDRLDAVNTELANHSARVKFANANLKGDIKLLTEQLQRSVAKECTALCKDLESDRDEWQRRAERAQPVLDAARAWREAIPHERLDDCCWSELERLLGAAVEQFDACPSCGPGGCAGPTRKPSALHIGRSWVGHEIEDGCPCPQAPCGLVDTDTIVADCTEHALLAAKSSRQGHWANECASVAEGLSSTDTTAVDHG